MPESTIELYDQAELLIVHIGLPAKARQRNLALAASQLMGALHVSQIGDLQRALCSLGHLWQQGQQQPPMSDSRPRLKSVL